MWSRDVLATDHCDEGNVMADDFAEFIGMLTDHQVDLLAFILSSLGDYSDTLDVLQRTNIVLWQKASQFRRGAPFLPWALKIAKFEILAFMRQRRRDRHVFCPEVVELMVDTAIERSGELSPRSDALRQCIKELPERSREFLRIRYAQQQSVKQISEKTGRSIDAVKSLYHRIRIGLARCIDRKVAGNSR
jgi:RNA polymerase sigma-70 factor (ECF subfamily)